MNRIVVIEDDPAILTGLEAMLRSESYDVLTAGNGEDGYRLVQERQPDLVILDLMLPKMNGYEICGQIRRHGLATPILMLTAAAPGNEPRSGIPRTGSWSALRRPTSDVHRRITECRNSVGEEFGDERLIDLVLHFELNNAASLARRSSAIRPRFQQ